MTVEQGKQKVSRKFASDVVSAPQRCLNVLMASAQSLIPGYTYNIIDGPLAGTACVIVDNDTFPDSHEHRRKVTVSIDGQIHYVLPRILDNIPCDNNVAALVTLSPDEVTTPITHPMDDRLDTLRPNPERVAHYIRRIMPNGKSDVEFLLEFATNPAYRSEANGYIPNIALKGDTQGGKTMLVEVLAVEWAKALGMPKPMPVFTLSGSSGVTDFDLFGQPASYTDEQGRERIVWLPGVVALAASAGGILYGDEVNAMGERVTSSMHPFLDHRRQFTNRNKPVQVSPGVFMPETVQVNPLTWCIATYNEGYRGMSQQNEAFINRFRHIEWDYSADVEKQLIRFVSVLTLGEACRLARSQGVLRTPVGTAALERLVTDVFVHGTDLALSIFVGTFPPVERMLVRDIIRDRSIDVLLEAEANPDTQTVPASTPSETSV